MEGQEETLLWGIGIGIFMGIIFGAGAVLYTPTPTPKHNPYCNNEIPQELENYINELITYK